MPPASPMSNRVSAPLQDRLARFPLSAALHPDALAGQDMRGLLAKVPLNPEAGDLQNGLPLSFHNLFDTRPAFASAVHEREEAAVDSLPHGSCEVIHLPCGLSEFCVPVCLRDEWLGVLWSGCYRTGTEALRECDLTEDDLTVIHSVPVWSDAEVRRVFSMYESWAALLAQAWSESLCAQNIADELRATERARALGTLSGGIAHHFNNLLSVILGYSSHLLNRLDLPDEAHDALLHISEAAQRGRRMTEEVLAFAGSEVEEEAVCSVHQMVQSLCPLLESQAAGRYRFICRLDASEDRVRSQRSLLHQTLYNLLTNSVDGLEEGSGDVFVRTANVQRREDETLIKYVHIQVADSPDDAGECLAELMLALDREQLVEAAPPRPPKKLASHTIWVVDDDPIFCEMCERVLGDDGHQVTSVSSGPALQKQYKSDATPPSLLIIDFSMPDYNGLELCTWLREEGCRAPVILVSGFSHSHPDIHKALKMRKTFFLQKPFPVPELADIVSVALGETLLGNVL